MHNWKKVDLYYSWDISDHDPELNLECQVESAYAKWEHDWSFYEIVVDCYVNNPDPLVKIYKAGECENEEDVGEKKATASIDAHSSENEDIE